MRNVVKVTRGALSVLALMASSAIASNPDYQDLYEARPSAPVYTDAVSPYAYGECQKTSGKWVGVFELANGYVIEHDDRQVHVYHNTSQSLHVAGRMLNFYKNRAFFDGCPQQEADGLLRVETTLAEFVSQVLKFGEIVSQQVVNRYAPPVAQQDSAPEPSQKIAATRSTRDMDSDNGLWGGPSYERDVQWKSQSSHEKKERNMDSDNALWG